MKQFMTACLAMALIFCTASEGQAQEAYSLYNTENSVVRIVVSIQADDPDTDFTLLPEGGKMDVCSSGFAVGDREQDAAEYIVTAANTLMHPVQPAGNEDTVYLLPSVRGGMELLHVQVLEIRVETGDGSVSVPAHPVMFSERADLAVLRLETPLPGIRGVVFRNPVEYRSAEEQNCLGYPSDAASGTGTAAGNILTGHHGQFSRIMIHAETGDGDVIYTSARMDEGMYGGPLTDTDGYVVGVCTTGTTKIDNMYHAAATSEIIRILDRIPGVSYELQGMEESRKNGKNFLAAGILAGAVLLILAAVYVWKNRHVPVLIFSGDLAGREIRLKKGSTVTAGRDKTRCDVVFPVYSEGIDGVHCRIIYDGKELTVEDAGSESGTYIDSSRIEPGGKAVIMPGQKLAFGRGFNVAQLFA